MNSVPQVDTYPPSPQYLSLLGALYCQIFDAIHPGYVQMKKVQWGARLDYEFLPNYKLLQKGFLQAGIAKPIEVERLMKGRYQDNLEFCQFLMYYFTREFRAGSDGREYDPIMRRKLSGCLCYPDWAPTPLDPIVRHRRPVLPSTRASTVRLSDDEDESSAPMSKVEARLRATERERDFYFGKLEAIEVLAKSGSMTESDILRILYSTAELDVCETPKPAPVAAGVVEHHCLSPSI